MESFDNTIIDYGWKQANSVNQIFHLLTERERKREQEY